MAELNTQFSSLENISFSGLAVNAHWGDQVSDYYNSALSQAIQNCENSVKGSIFFYHNQIGQAIIDIETVKSNIFNHDYSSLIVNFKSKVEKL